MQLLRQPFSAMPLLYLHMAHPLITFLQSHGHIPAQDHALIEDAWTQRSFKEGDVLFEPGKICREYFFITNGVLRIMMPLDNGQEVTHFFLKEQSFCTILHSFNHQETAQEGIQAACDAEVLSIGRDDLMALYAKLPYLKPLINEISNAALLAKIRVRNAYLGQDAANRYKLFLERQPDIASRVALKDIAGYLGITPQSLSRIRKESR